MSGWVEATYRAEGRRLFRLAWLIVRDVSAAEDAVHVAFVRMLTVREQPENPLAFARRSVRNAAIDERRRRGRAVTDVVDESHSDDSAVSVSVGLEVQEILRTLTDAQREVVEYRLRLRMTFREIADFLDEPVSTVSSRFQRAIEQLQELTEVRDE